MFHENKRRKAAMPKEMNRRDFLRKGTASLAGVTLLPMMFKQEQRDKNIIYRSLGKTGIKLPVISMGVMNADNPNLVRAALDRGIVHLDTAWYYQGGRNERMVGNVVKDRPRDSYVIGTKILMRQDRNGLFDSSGTSSHFLDKFYTSLKRLQLDYVDILYHHNIFNPRSLTYKPYLDAMLKMKEEGKIRFFGVSTHRNEPAVIREAADCGYYDVVLTAYNFRQSYHREVASAIQYAAGKGMGIVGMKAIAGFVQNIGGDHSRINAKAAIKWALQNENIHTNIPGFTTFDQLETDISIMSDLTLTKEEISDLKREQQSSGLYCQQCQKCVSQCPAEVDIPTLMRSYMYAYGYKNLQAAKEALAMANIKAIECTECDVCQVKCTEGFEIKARAVDVMKVSEIPGRFLV
jgi:predicted aldo/keto reductase-like oxidoreductase